MLQGDDVRSDTPWLVVKSTMAKTFFYFSHSTRLLNSSCFPSIVHRLSPHPISLLQRHVSQLAGGFVLHTKRSIPLRHPRCWVSRGCSDPLFTRAASDNLYVLKSTTIVLDRVLLDVIRSIERRSHGLVQLQCSLIDVTLDCSMCVSDVLVRLHADVQSGSRVTASNALNVSRARDMHVCSLLRVHRCNR